jgi:Sec-independent protein translocase protein TatA
MAANTAQAHDVSEVKLNEGTLGGYMSRNDSAGPFFAFLVGIGVGAAVVILLGSKRIDQLHDDVNEALNDGLHQFRRTTKDLKRQAQRTVASAQHKVQEAINAGADAYGEAKNS